MLKKFLQIIWKFSLNSHKFVCIKERDNYNNSSKIGIVSKLHFLVRVFYNTNIDTVYQSMKCLVNIDISACDKETGRHECKLDFCYELKLE